MAPSATGAIAAWPAASIAAMIARGQVSARFIPQIETLGLITGTHTFVPPGRKASGKDAQTVKPRNEGDKGD
jgi:hypothetical protein